MPFEIKQLNNRSGRTSTTTYSNESGFFAAIDESRATAWVELIEGKFPDGTVVSKAEMYELAKRRSAAMKGEL
jgi:hypothetical protein